jgi:hypothetical protein
MNKSRLQGELPLTPEYSASVAADAPLAALQGSQGELRFYSQAEEQLAAEEEEDAAQRGQSFGTVYSSRGAARC